MQIEYTIDVNTLIVIGGLVINGIVFALSGYFSIKQLKIDVAEIKKKVYNGLSDKVERIDNTLSNMQGRFEVLHDEMIHKHE